MANRLELTEEISNQASVIEAIEVESSQIAKIGYNSEASLLMIEFKNKKSANSRYVYQNVTAEQFESFENAESVGRYFGEHFKTLDFCKLEG